MQKEIEYTEPGSGETLALTVGTASALEYARYQAVRREAAQYCKEQLGYFPWDSERPDESDPERLRILDIVDIAFHRTYMLACLKRGTLPAEWASVEGFAANIPAPLYTQWRLAAIECNPHVFWVDPSPEASKKGPSSAN